MLLPSSSTASGILICKLLWCSLKHGSIQRAGLFSQYSHIYLDSSDPLFITIVASFNWIFFSVGGKIYLKTNFYQELWFATSHHWSGQQSFWFWLINHVQTLAHHQSKKMLMITSKKPPLITFCQNNSCKLDLYSSSFFRKIMKQVPWQILILQTLSFHQRLHISKSPK